MKTKLANFSRSLLSELKTKHFDFNQIVLKCIIIALFIFLSMFWLPFTYIALVLALCFIVFQFNGRALYFIIFLLPLMHIFRPSCNDYYFLIYLVGAGIVMLGVKLLIDIIKKNKKIHWIFSILFAINCLYFTIFMQGISYWGSLMMGVAVLFLAFYYKEDLSRKELIFVFGLGIICSCLIGLCRDFSRLSEFVGEFYHYVPRFSGAYINPNVLMGESLLCLALTMVLYLNKEINYIFYPLYTIFGVFILSTISKVGLIGLATISIIFFLVLIYRKLSKQQVCKFVSCLLSLMLCFTICYKPTNAILGRLNESIVTGTLNPPSAGINGDSGIISGSLNSGSLGAASGEQTKIDLTILTTGRIDIWISYLKKIVESPKSILFGYGVGAPFVGEWMGYGGWTPHNTFIQCLYYVGIFGILLLIAWFASILTKESCRNFNWYSMIAIIGLGIYLCDAEFFSFRLGVYMTLILFVMQKNKKEELTLTAEHESVGMKIPKKIHYIWLGKNPLPKVAEKCIESWKKYCPDYEIKRWDESNLDIDICNYCREAYDAKKFAFASDVLRFDILNKEGGIYLDIDVKLLANIDDLLGNKMFMAFESQKNIAPGLAMGSIPSNKHLTNMLEVYKNLKFNENGKLNIKTVCEITTEYLLSNGLVLNGETQVVEDVKIYSSEYFCPLSPVTDQTIVTDKTKAIHLYNASWFSTKAKIKKVVKKILNFSTNGYFGLLLYKYKKRNLG